MRSLSTLAALLVGLAVVLWAVNDNLAAGFRAFAKSIGFSDEGLDAVTEGADDRLKQLQGLWSFKTMSLGRDAAETKAQQD